MRQVTFDVQRQRSVQHDSTMYCDMTIIMTVFCCILRRLSERNRLRHPHLMHKIDDEPLNRHGNTTHHLHLTFSVYFNWITPHLLLNRRCFTPDRDHRTGLYQSSELG
jgi:hypothetical protein